MPARHLKLYWIVRDLGVGLGTTERPGIQVPRERKLGAFLDRMFPSWMNDIFCIEDRNKVS